jgi:hypothetical protein
MDNIIRQTIEAEVRLKIYNEIIEYKETCIKNGISNYFISGLDVSADIAMNTREIKKEQKETLF